MKLKFVAVVAAAWLSGCAMVPENLQVADEALLISYTQACTSGESAIGKPTRWGGIIAGVENKPGQTIIEVAHFPLNHYGRPALQGETMGRFKAVINGFVDPLVVEKGRSITFTGTLQEPLAGMVGEQPYVYPSITADDYYLWREREVYNVTGLFFDYHMGWYSPFYHPFYRTGWGWRHSRFYLNARSTRSGYERDWSTTPQRQVTRSQHYDQQYKNRQEPKQVSSRER